SPGRLPAPPGRARHGRNRPRRALPGQDSAAGTGGRVGSTPVDTGSEHGMGALPAGRVMLSDRRTRRRWPVELAPYRICVVPVTQRRYAQVTGEQPSASRGGRLPVESVSWWDAVHFCNALSRAEGLTPVYRLDDDAED